MKKNIITNTIKFLGMAAIGITAAACTGNFEDMGVKPYRPTYIKPEQLLTPMIRNIISTHENDSQMIDQMIGMEYGGYTSANTVWNGSGAFATYNPRQGWLGETYNTLFQKTYANWAEIKENTGGVGATYQMAQIIRVATMLKVTDTYGPIPYTKVNGQDIAVAYDSQKDLYLAMLDDLEAASDVLQAYATDPGSDQTLFQGHDVSTFNGDVKKWVKYANSLRLRMAIRMSKTDEAGKAQEIAETLAKRADALIESNSDNLYIIPEAKNPYTQSTDWNDGELRINASLTSYMNGYEDPRRADYFTQVSGQFVGLRSGIKSPGAQYKNTVSKMYFENGTSTNLLAMCAAEVAFLKAEGVLLGWDMGDTAENLYNKGITLSFEQHGANGVADYLQSEKAPANYTDPVNSSYSANAVSTLSPKWNASATPEEQLERLMIQKWIAMYPYGFEAWCDIRRTGYPKLFQVADNLSNGVVSSTRGMRRVPYSRKEYDTNEANVRAALTLLGGEDTGAVDLWWAKKN